MAMAIDREGIAEAVTFGHGTLANSPLPNTLDYYDADLPAIPYDPEGARALLQEAGATGKSITFMTTGTTEDQTTQLIQAQLAEVGLNATIEQVDSGTWWDRLPNAQYQATVSWWYNETPDPDAAVRWALCGTCGNESFYTFYVNEEIDRLTEEAVTETDPAKRGELYARIQALALEEVSQIPLYYQPYQNAHRATVQGLVMNPAIQWSLDEASLGQ
jgi:peptide/nickel transport system substrate-binding protein